MTSGILVKIYTRTGDGGETGLVGGVRVSKDSLRVQAYGEVDELNSVLGISRTFLVDEELDKLLQDLQRDLFVVAADLAAPLGTRSIVPRITGEKVSELENTIDRLEEELPRLQVFIFPGGSRQGAFLHFARTVARRAERTIVRLSDKEAVNEQIVPYVNRLSDLLFVMARVINHRCRIHELEWHENAKAKKTFE